MKINYLYNHNDYKIFYVDEINSTNTFFKENYLNYADKSVLVANKQTQGRGRLNHKWVSNNDLIFSIIFKEKQNYLIISIAMIKALKEIGLNALIKWPNDIFLNDIKISGILIEDIYLNEFNSSIVGIGLNLTDKEEFNVKNLGNLYTIDKFDLLKIILNKIDELSTLSNENIILEYKKYSLLYGRNITYKQKEYKVIGFDILGYMILKNDEEIIKVFYGEVGFSNKSFNLE